MKRSVRLNSAWRVVLRSVLGAFALVSALFALRSLEVPFAWVGLGWAVACVGVMATCRQSLAKAAWFNVAVAFLVLAGIEVVLDREQERGNGVHDEAFDRAGDEVDRFPPDPVLGFAHTGGMQVHWQRFHRDRAIFDIWYEIDDDRMRVSPASDRPPSQCVVFLGGSFTFGAGVQDWETLPYRVGEAAGVEAFNFGYSGYGPHQALMLLESGAVGRKSRCTPTHVIYLGIEDHARRVAGKAPWDQEGPRYVATEDGLAQYTGFIDRHGEPWAWRVRNQLIKSRILQRVLFFRSPIRDSDADLMVSVIATMDAKIAEAFPGARFDVLFWDVEDTPITQRILSGVQARGLSLHPVSRILPHFQSELARYELDEHDAHPNALAYELLADYVSSAILTPRRTAAR